MSDDLLKADQMLVDNLLSIEKASLSLLAGAGDVQYQQNPSQNASRRRLTLQSSELQSEFLGQATTSLQQP